MQHKDSEGRPEPMSPHANNFPPSVVSLPTEKTIATASSAPGRRCSQCSTLVPITHSYKQCDLCRAKGRSASARGRERKNALEKVMMLKGDAARSKTGSNGVKRSLENNNENGTDEEGWDQVSKRLKTELTYMKGKEKKVGRADITVASVEKLRRQRHLKEQVARSISNAVEYQTSGLAYASLLAQSPSKTIQFTASYAIVATAIAPISLQRRVELVCRELRARLRALGGGFDRHSPVDKSSTPLSETQTFNCTCSTGQSTSPSAATSAADPKYSKNILVNYFGGSTSKRNGPGVARVSCGGTIRVTVEDDFSHHVGIKGHRIIIEVEHPDL